MKWKSYCKVNLYLDVLNKREDGYHNIDTLFMTVSLFDSISITESPDVPKGEIVFECSIEELNNKDNLIWKGIELIKPYFPKDRQGIRVSLEKVIPFGAGLGGGSSNGSTMLLAFREYFGLELTDEALMDMASSLGADAPFFVRGGFARGQGIGDELNYYDGLIFPYYFIIIKPPIHGSTPEAYQGLKLDKVKSEDGLANLLRAIRLGDLDMLCKHLYNKFEDSQFIRYPVLREIKESLLASGASGALMSGSGSSVFGIYRTKELAANAVKLVERDNHQVFLVEAVSFSV